ncbi:hypothetical protein H0H92_010119 [Tricholoma furcatifolium]|nr:hypothetical protein H0H92_010119 [Tricholoma furcatifolium]
MYVYRGRISWSNKFRNEGITIIFPSARAPGAQVYLFSQWSTIPIGLNGKAFSSLGVVRSSNDLSETTTTLSFPYPSGSIDLFATHSDNSLLLHIGDGVLAEVIATLSLVYQSDAYPRVYTGNLNLEVSAQGDMRKAVDEPLLVVSSHDAAENGVQMLLCVFTQWIATDTTDSVNADFISSSELNANIITAPQLSLSGEGFTFSLKQGDPNGSQVLVVETQDTMFKSEVPLSLYATRFTVTNKMAGFINCEVTTEQPLASDIFEYGGYSLAAIGILFAFASTGIGFSFAVGSYFLSNLPAIWNAGVVKEARYTGMPPGDSFQIDVSENMYILVMTVEQAGQQVVIKYARQMYSSGGNISIDETLPWKTIVALSQAVPTGRQMVCRGLLQLPNVRASMVGNAVNDHNNFENMGIYSGNMNWSIDPLYHRAFREEYSGLPLLEYRDDWNACVAFSSMTSGDCRIVRLYSTPYKPYLVLVLRFAQLQGADSDDDSTSLTGAIPVIGQPGKGSTGRQTRSNLEANLLHAIQSPTTGRYYPMYYYTPSNNYGILRGVKPGPQTWTVTRLKKSESPSTYTLIRIAKPVVINPVYTLTS